MLNINVLVHDLGLSQFNFYMIKTLNRWAMDKIAQPIVFFETASPICVKPHFAIMQMSEAWLQPGITLATTPQTATKLGGFPRCSRKLLYVWDLWWLRPQYRTYQSISQIFLNKDIELIARSEPHAFAIKNCFNRTVVGIADNFQLQELLENGTKTI